MTQLNYEELIEKMARAMCIAKGINPDGPTNDIYIADDPNCIYPWASYRNMAKATLSALQECLPNIDKSEHDDLSLYYQEAKLYQQLKTLKGKD